MSAEDAVSERVRFDDNISFIDDSMGGEELVINAGGSGVSDNVSLSGRLLKVIFMICLLPPKFYVKSFLSKSGVLTIEALDFNQSNFFNFSGLKLIVIQIHCPHAQYSCVHRLGLNCQHWTFRPSKFAKFDFT